MKKFYQAVAVISDQDGWTITLDNKPVKTPTRQNLSVPNAALAQAIADEWSAQDDKIVPATMPLTQLAMTALDRVSEVREKILETLTTYARHDLLCYRTPLPADWLARQRAVWDPVVERLRRDYGFGLMIDYGLGDIEQPAESLAKIQDWLSQRDDWQLSALQVLIPTLGSVGLGCAVFDGWLTAAQASEAAMLEELYQNEHWGTEPEAVERRQGMMQEVDNCCRFLFLLSPAAVISSAH